MPPRKKASLTAEAKAALLPGSLPEQLAVTTDEQVAQRYALRVWGGQSPDLPLIERVKRIKSALAGQGLSMDGVVLPAEGFEKYL